MRSQHRPVIGINVDLVQAGKGRRPVHRVSAGFSDLVLLHGGLPLIMPTLERDLDRSDFLDKVDGFILTGGAPLDPRLQGGVKPAALSPMLLRRDEHDRNLVRQLLERKIPILASDVGMLQLNLALGGTMYHFLPDEAPKAMLHLDPSSEDPHRHLVRFVAGSRLEGIYGSPELLVHSHHQQAVRKLADGLQPAAFAPDGIMEAFESVDPAWFCVGLQWKPESEAASALDQQLFDAFVSACGATTPVLAAV